MPRSFTAGLLVWCAGCASITAKPTDTLYVSSTPPGAQVLVGGTARGQAPMPVELDRKENEPVELALPGYQTRPCETRMSPGTNYVVADVVMCVLLFPFGCISFIDAGGAWNELQHHNCNLTLEPAYPAPPGSYPAPPSGYPAPPSYPPPPQSYPPPSYPPPAPANSR